MSSESRYVRQIKKSLLNVPKKVHILEWMWRSIITNKNYWIYLLIKMREYSFLNIVASRVLKGKNVCVGFIF